MNTINNNRDIPQIKIGIIQSADKVSFICDHDFKINDLSNKTIATGKAAQKYELKISSSQPAIIHYQIRIAVFKDKEQTITKVASLNQQRLKTNIRIVGLEIPFKKKIIDNREYWVTIGKFTTKHDANEFAVKNKLPDDAIIVEEIVKKASGNIYHDKEHLGDRFKIIPIHENALTEVHEVPIGIEFHWQRQETLVYRGDLEIGFNNRGNLEVINEIDIENYLASVNSSEMTPDCPLALLEAQTIAARSTVLATMGKHHYNTDFHLCSDDHCQCYQGVTREQEISRIAMKNTFGEVMILGDEICDARYSKICGGIMESYENVWEERTIPYLVAGIDSKKPIDFPADTEDKAKSLIDSDLPVFCNTNLYKLPEKLANLYSTQNLFRWEVIYEREELENIITQKLNLNLGELKDIRPLVRGASGRLIYIELVGSNKTIKIGKELAIRKVLSKSHLYSSCFYVVKELSSNGKVNRFILKGAGWGHGVGLCQVGATVMALKGYHCNDILNHYYKNIQIIKLY